MRRLSSALLVAVLAVPASPSVDIDLQNGSSVVGSLDPIGAPDSFRIEVPAGAVLRVKAKGRREGPVVGVRITDAAQAEVETEGLRLTRTGVSGKVPLLGGGSYLVEVTAREDSAPGDYKLNVRWKSPRRFTEAPPADTAGGTVPFRADAGAKVKATVKAARGSSVVPQIVRITGPDEYVLDVPDDSPAKRPGDALRKVVVPATGDYVVHYVDSAAAGGAVKAKVLVKPPRPTRVRFDVSSEVIGTVGADLGAAVGVVARPGAETFLDVPVTIDDDEPLSGIGGAAILVPVGALTRPVALVLGTSTPIEPPAGGVPGLRAAGPSVHFGPEGQQFDVPVTITLPADVVPDQEDVVVLTRAGNATSQVAADPDVGNGIVSIPVSHFSSFQVFTTPLAEFPLVDPSAVAGAEFGFSVAIDGDTAVVGAQFDNSTVVNSGAAYVFVRGTGGEWTPQARLTASDPMDGDRFGAALALDGDTVIVGSRLDDDLGSGSGSATVFTRDGGGSWTFQAKLTASDGGPDDRFGFAVALDGDTAVVGAYLDGPGQTERGAAYAFVRDGGGSWSEQARLSTTDATSVALLGGAVSVDGDTAVVGASANDASGLDSGRAYVFTRDGIGVWSQQSALVGPRAAAEDRFGAAVAVDGDTVVVAARGRDDAAENAGSVYVFTRAAGEWTVRRRFSTSTPVAGDRFGYSIAVNEGKAVVGTLRTPPDASNTGRAFAFDLDQ